MSDEIILVGATTLHEQAIDAALDAGPAQLTSWTEPVNGNGSIDLLTRSRPSVVVLGPDLGDRAFDVARSIEDADPTVATILIAQSTNLVLQKAMAAGIRGVLEPTARVSTIKTVVEQAIDAGRRLRGSHPGLALQADKRFITIVSAKGGAGKTVVSSNLAAVLAAGTDRETVLVDLDLQFGDAATALQLDPPHSIMDAAEAASSLDVAALKVFLTQHPPTDLHVLCAPAEPAAGETLPGTAVATILDTLAEEFLQVVVDTDPGLSETTLTALERSTDIVVVADLDVPSVRGTRKLVDALDAIGMHGPNRYLVLNRADSKVGLSQAEVEKAVGMPVDVALPSTRQVPVSVNEGQPMVLGSRRSSFSKQMLGFAKRLVPAPASEGNTT